MALTRIPTSGITDLSVTTAKLVNNSITTSKLAPTIAGSFITVSGVSSCYINATVAYTITNYNSATTYTVNSPILGTVSMLTDTITFICGATSGAASFILSDGNFNKSITLTVNPAGILAPSITSPTTGAINITETPTFTTSEFTTVGSSDTHASTTWEIWTGSNGTGTLVHTSVNDTTNKTSYTLATGILSVSVLYYVRAKHTGTTLGSSQFSSDVSFTTSASFGGKIGVAGAMGFGIGNYVGTLPSGFSNTSSNTDVNHANYGNYTYTDGSVMCFVPKFYYRIGHTSSPNYATYGLNAVDIVGIDTFASTSAANTAGYALHRAFIDGGIEKSGFFFDKYKCSNGTVSNTGTLTGAIKSQFGGVPISLTTTSTYTRSQNYVTTEGTCTGILADGVMLARTRGIGVFNVPTIFMYSALGMLSLAHGQSSTGVSACAWYDATLTTNFPKGCSSGSLTDTSDGTVTYVTAGDSGSSAKPKTGATANFNKTTHNGQANGIADLNGGMYELMLGLTNSGSSATDNVIINTNSMYILKQSVSYLTLKGGWNTTNDAWQNSSNITASYDVLTTTATFSAVGDVNWGNSTNQVFSPATTGNNWLNTGAGLPLNDTSTNTIGTNLFGMDLLYKYNCANMTPLSCGDWSGGASAGLFYRIFTSSRSDGDNHAGFRASSVGA